MLSFVCCLFFMSPLALYSGAVLNPSPSCPLPLYNANWTTAPRRVDAAALTPQATPALIGIYYDKQQARLF